MGYYRPTQKIISCNISSAPDAPEVLNAYFYEKIKRERVA